jgi:CHASE2 domain-containing sensor protein
MADRVTSKNRFNTLSVLIVGAAWFVALLSMSVVGILAGAGPRRGRVLLATVVLSTAVFYAFFFTQVRYRIPVEPQLVALAALGLASAFPRFSGSLAEAGAEPARGHA